MTPRKFQGPAGQPLPGAASWRLLPARYVLRGAVGTGCSVVPEFCEEWPVGRGPRVWFCWLHASETSCLRAWGAATHTSGLGLQTPPTPGETPLALR